MELEIINLWPEDFFSLFEISWSHYPQEYVDDGGPSFSFSIVLFGFEFTILTGRKNKELPPTSNPTEDDKNKHSKPKSK